MPLQIQPPARLLLSAMLLAALSAPSARAEVRISGEPDAEDKDNLSERLKAIASKKLYKRARTVGAAIRAAHMLSIGRPGIIDETPLTYERNKLVLTVPKAYAALDGERLRRRFAALAGLLEREPEIRVKA